MRGTLPQGDGRWGEEAQPEPKDGRHPPKSVDTSPEEEEGEGMNEAGEGGWHAQGR